MFVDFVLNGQGYGPVAQQMAGCRFDPGLMRPYRDSQGRPCVTVNTGRTRFNQQTKLTEPIYENHLISNLRNLGIDSPVFNAATLRKDEWSLMDTVVQREARQRLSAWADLAAANTYGGFNGMSKSILESESMSDPGEAVQDMDGLTEGRTDTPLYARHGLPLPITHSDFYFSSRVLNISRSGGSPLDLTMAEAAGRRVAEMIEKDTIGMQTGLTYGDSTPYSETSQVYGYTTHPNRNIKADLTKPTAVGWTPETTLNDVLAMRQMLYLDNFMGPYMLYVSSDWDQYLDGDYYAKATSGMVAPTQTLRQRLENVKGITAVKTLDFFTSTFSMVLIQMTSDVARAVIGMNITTVQWESVGGMRLNFKVMCIMVPQVRATYAGKSGICHGSAA
ncbi:bacteriocin family protein [Candidatus Pacearchaeota archaeon]|jgi:hypothetical protein|nr:bacteriocin family protein [Candidatus Pacearchaeota archaeon]